ncbi:MAG TPA: hypothetical protein VNK45_02635 [Candidatus Acidoferrales bacterium]|nr:hypothetical protein [Candidatus Acidoferrales bacterium]
MAEAMAAGAGFDADWLRWREPADIDARDSALLSDWLAGVPDGGRVVELGAGTGALLRACLLRLRGAVRWRALEVDAGLIARAEGQFHQWAGTRAGWAVEGDASLTLCGPAASCVLDWQCTDLAAAVPDLDGVDAVAASAWGDLVSWRWAACFAAQAAMSGIRSVYLALNVVDGAVFAPADPLDGALDRAFAAHMRRDKGFGPALGGAAVPGWSLALCLAGYRVRGASSVWSLGPAHPLLTAAWLEGYVRAACEQVPRLRESAGLWLRERLAQLARGTLRVAVNHTDLLAWRD